MKDIIIFLASLLLLTIGCSKDDDSSTTPIIDTPGCCEVENDTIYKTITGLIGTWDGSSIVSADGNILIVGRNQLLNTYKMLLIKTTVQGEIIYSKTFHEANSEALGIYEDSERNIYAVGYSREDIHSNRSKLLVAKLDQDGIVIWEKSYHAQEDLTGYHVSGINNNEILVSGSRDGDLFFLKIDSMGQELLFKIEPSSSYRVPSSMLLLQDGNILITGSDEDGIYLMSYNKEADFLWRKTFGSMYSFGRSTIQLSDGSLITVGHNTHVKGVGNQIDSQLVVIIKTDSKGGFIWEKEVGNINYLSDGQSIAENEDGSFVLTGYALSGYPTKTDHMLIYVDPEGNEINSKYFTDEFTFRGENIVKLENGRNVITGGYQGLRIFFLNVDNYGLE